MKDFQEELSGSRVEDEDGAIDRFRRQVTFECLVDRHTVHVGVVDEPCEYCETTLSHHQNEACAYK